MEACFPRRSFECLEAVMQGTIDMRDIGYLLDGVRLVAHVDPAAWNEQDEAAMMAWVTEYVDGWLVSQVRIMSGQVNLVR